MNGRRIGDDIEAAMRSPSLQDAASNLAEIVLDAMLDEGAFRDVPLIGTLVSLGRTSVAIRDRLFLKKLCHFLGELGSVPTEDRVAAIAKLQNSTEYRVSVGEKVLYIVDRCQDHLAAQNIGRVFRAFLEGSISYSEFVRLATCIDRILADDLRDFLSREWKHVPVYEGAYLVGTGLVNFDEAEVRVEDQDDWKSGNKYVVENDDQTVSLSALGAKLKRILGSSRMNVRGAGGEGSWPA